MISDQSASCYDIEVFQLIYCTLIKTEAKGWRNGKRRD